MAKIQVKDTEVSVVRFRDEDYISLTDMVRKIENGLALIEKWLRNKNTIEFLGTWEEVYNPDFNSPEFEGIRNEAGTNRFLLSVKQWCYRTNSTGIVARTGRYGGTYAHRDIAFEFASWLSPQFKLYLLIEFQRLKEQEQAKLQARLVFASEADLLNVALFGMTAKQWRDANPNQEGNIRDYADINQLICLSNMESMNSVLIESGISQQERLLKLNEMAIRQMEILFGVSGRELLK